MRILIIGNGFDLDLGLPTRYKDFIHSKESECLSRWKDMPIECLAPHLLNCLEGNWFDIEEAMADYVKAKETAGNYHNVLADVDRQILKDLKENFWEYVSNKMQDIGNNSWKGHVRDSLAKNIIEMQKKAKFFDKIYSFNCFDCIDYEIASNQEIENLSGVTYIHGTGYDFILGIGENDCKSKEYSFLKKVNQKGYSFEIVKKFKSNLVNADTVVIFGHSLNRIDMVYFRSMLWNIYLYPNTQKRIAIITKDKKSADQIKENISGYGPIPFDNLSNSCQLKFLYTDNYDFMEIDNIEDIFKI